MKLSFVLATAVSALFAVPAAAQNDQSINYGVGPPSPYEGRDMNFDIKFGDTKRDAETQRARQAKPQTTINAEDFIPLDKVTADKLDGATVDNASGIAIGHVTDLTAAKDGSVSELEIALDKAGKLRVHAEDLRFNPSDRTLLLANVDNNAAASLAAGEAGSEQ